MTPKRIFLLIFGAPDDELLPSEDGNINDFYPVDPTQLPPELIREIEMKKQNEE